MRRTLLLFLLLLVLDTQGQSPSFQNFRVREGLPSSEIYCVLQDQHGYMWFGTDRGVTRYDGADFKTFTTSDGLTDDVVFRLHEDQSGKIWMLTSNGELCYTESGKIKVYEYNQVIQNSLESFVKYLHSFYVDKHGNIYLGTFANGLIKIDKDGNKEELDPFNKTGVSIYPIEGTYMSFQREYYRKPIKTNHFSSLIINGTDLGLDHLYNVSSRVETSLLKPHLLCLNTSHELLVFDLNLGKVVSSLKFDRKITFMKVIDDQIMVGSYTDGMRALQLKDGKIHLVRHFLQGLSPSYILKDRQGGYWITTTEEGIFYAPNFEVLSLQKGTGLAGNHVNELRYQNGGVLIGLQDSIQYWTKGGIQWTILKQHLNGEQGNLFYIRDNHVFYRGGKFLNLDNSYVYPVLKSLGLVSVTPLGKDEWQVFSKSSRSRIKVTGGKIEAEFEHFMRKINQWMDCVHLNDDNSFFFGTKSGLILRKSSGALVHLGERHPLLAHRVVDLGSTKKYGIVVATRGAGVVLYKNNKTTQIGEKQGLITNDITALFVDNDDNIWVATNLGLHKIDGKDPSKIAFYSTQDGLISNEVTSLTQVESKLFVGTKRGLSILNIDSYQQKKYVPNITIEKILLNGKRVSHKHSIDIYPEDKRLEIFTIAIDYPSSRNIEYRYRIKGASEEWNYTKNGQIILESFPERGTYNIEVQARRKPNGRWNSNSALIELNFHPPYYKTWWFRISLITLIGVLIFLSFYFKIFRYDKHIQEELVNRILRKLGRKHYLVLTINKKETRIDQNQILFIEAYKDYCEINTASKKYLYRSTMKKMEETLPSYNFIRVHRSYIVCKAHIDAIATDHLLVRDKEIPVGKTYRTGVKQLKDQFSRINT